MRTLAAPRRNVGLVWALVLCTALPVSARIIYVDDDVHTSGDGLSWQTAYRFLQDALADANATPGSVEVRVAQGIYKPDQGTAVTPGDIGATFSLAGSATLAGGYAGVGTSDPDARDIESFQTVLSGDLAGNDLPIVSPPVNPYNYQWNEPDRADNSLCVVTVGPGDANSTTALEGVTIAGAHSHNSPAYMVRGVGGLYIEAGANAIVRDCTFTLNTAPGIGSRGEDVTVSDCVFRKNVALAHGGGMWIAGNSPRVVRCLFEDNWARNGGGLYTTAVQLQLDDCTFTGNVACGLTCFDVGFGGGLHCARGAGAIIDGCSFIGNVGSFGGGVDFGSVGLTAPGPPGRSGPILLTGCLFVGNQAREGGAMSAQSFTVDVEHSAFRCNLARGDSSRSVGGAVGNWESATRFSNCVFSGNAASDAGAVIWAVGGGKRQWRNTEAWENFDVVLGNCTLVGNVAPVGQTIACNSVEGENRDTAIVSNCILDNGGYEIDNPNGSHVAIAFTDLLGGVAAVNDPCNAVVCGEGNINVDPLLAAPGYWDPNGTPDDLSDDFWVDGDYHLKSQAGRWDPISEGWVIDEVTSPCIDAGDPNSPIGLEPFPNGGRINMGAYGSTLEASKSYFGESLCETTMAGDINGDCKVDFADLAILVDHWYEGGSE